MCSEDIGERESAEAERADLKEVASTVSFTGVSVSRVAYGKHHSPPVDVQFHRLFDESVYSSGYHVRGCESLLISLK